MRFIIAIDASPRGLMGVHWVSHLPLSPRDEVLLVSVVHAPVMAGAWGYTDTDVNRRAIDRARSTSAWQTPGISARTLDELRGLPCPVHAVELEGHPVAALEQAVREYDADLLVLGSVSRSLMRTMPTSILVAREPFGAPRRILLATAGQGWGAAVAEHVVAFPIARDAIVDVISVYERRSHWFRGGRMSHGDGVGTALEGAVSGSTSDARAILDATGRTGTSTQRDGDPTHAIVDVARAHQSDLIIVGRAAHRGLRGRVQGGVPCAVCSIAPCSTLVVGSRHEPLTDPRLATPTLEVGVADAASR